MEEIIICPQCNNIIYSEKCNLCNYIISKDNLLIDIVHSEYNKALLLLDNKGIMEAWEKMKDAIMIFPYLLIPLKFCFYLSLEVGEYQMSIEYLNQLKPLMKEEEYINLLKLLSGNIKIYNSILINISTGYSIDELSYIHLHLLFLQRNKNYDIEKVKECLNNYYNYFNIQEKKIISKYQLLLGSISIIILIIFIISNNNNLTRLMNESKYFQIRNIDLVKEIKEGEKKLQMQNSSDLLLSILSELYVKENIQECSNILINNPHLINHIEYLNQTFIIEEICKRLYSSKDYDSILSIDYESKKTPDALYYQSIKNSNDRINSIEKFVNRYPSYDWYTAPFLRELFDYYEYKDSSKAMQYAEKLKEYLKEHPEEIYKKYYSKKIKDYFFNGDKDEL